MNSRTCKILIMKKFIVFTLLLLLFTRLNAGIISTSPDVCIGNLAYFKVQGVSGFNSITWEFGDGYTSNSNSPFHLYKITGTFKIKVTINLSSGGTQSDSMTLTVHELPKAILTTMIGYDSCLFTNEFKFKDESTMSSSNNTITKRLMVWGDGDFDNNNNRQFGDVVSHHYKMKDVYKIKMEITDNKGCKASTLAKVRIIDGSLAKIKYEVKFPKCGEAEVCFENDSKIPNGAQPNYIWTFDGGNPQSLSYNSKKCFNTTTNKTYKAKLEIVNPNNTCYTKDTIDVFLNTAGISNNLSLNDTVFCYGSSGIITISNTQIEKDISYAWSLNGTPLKATSSAISLTPKNVGLSNPLHTITCTVSKGACVQSFSRTFKIIGPIARLKVFNKDQCGIEKRVFFIDTSLNISKKNASYRWDVVDPEGDNCVINRDANINKYKNCNTTIGWFGKHDYTVPRGVNKIRLTITDNSNGCADTAYENVNHFKCKLCKRGGFITICQGDTFIPLNKDEIGPIAFTLDTGKTWMKFPSQVNKPYKGWYGVGFIFENKEPEFAEDFGDDSIIVYRNDSTWFDTLFVDNFLYVKETLDTNLTLKITSACKPFTAEVGFVHPNFKKGDVVFIDWKDGNTTTLTFTKDSIVNSVKHIYTLSGLDTLLDFQFISHEGCARSRKLKIQFGKHIKYRVKGKPCLNETLCFDPVIDNFFNLSIYNNLVSIKWIDSDKKTHTSNQFCKQFKRYGRDSIYMITEDSLSCIDTLKIPIGIRQLKAGIVGDARISFCSELKQMFDSSYYVYKEPKDVITKYIWDFGSGNYTTLEKNPFRSFDLKDSIIKVMHIVEDTNACRDTINFNIEVKGSVPEFSMKDTIGCSPLKVSFKNLSRKCSSYIWEFDDYSNSTLEDVSKKDQTYLYLKAGKFYPKLIGIDTFYNPYTGAVYYCHETYDPKIGVTVFETKFTELTSIDTICLGQTINFNCKSNASNVYWDFGDNTKFKDFFKSTVTYKYGNAGTYKVTYSPRYNFGTGNPICTDSMTKTIVVLGVTADFEIADNSEAPIFRFKNFSNPISADFLWNYGDPGSGSDNSSTNVNGQHNYGTNNGKFVVCLTASVFNKCKDSVCKPIENDYVQDIVMFNVFTPSVSSGYNDEYDVTIVGEDKYHLKIYDRWGVLVYESFEDGVLGDGINWNGKVNNQGANCPSGTYYYIFDYSFKIDPEKMLNTNGTITLIRQ